jgi:uncharacterized protein YjbI with pentapeptide repeats
MSSFDCHVRDDLLEEIREDLREVCKNLGFYGEHEGEEYCVLHYPDKEKEADARFREALERKRKERDFDFSGVYFSDNFGIFTSFVFEEPANFSLVTFAEGANFAESTFKEEAYFSNVTFQGQAQFHKAIFEKDVLFQSATFKEGAGFSAATFKGRANFSYLKSDGSLNFSGGTFEDTADFSDATFAQDYVSFSGINFEGEVLPGATFRSNAVFSKTVFEKQVSLGGATFQDIVHFDDVSFKEGAHCLGTTFEYRAIFSGSIFDGSAYFYEAAFGEETFFDKASFQGEALFKRATFSGKANFPEATFNGETLFREVTFNEEARFDGAIFNEVVHFHRATFNEETHFDGAIFEGEAHFQRVRLDDGKVLDASTFSKDVHFSKAIFKEVAHFHKVTFSGEAHFPDVTFENLANFHGALFKERAAFYSLKTGHSTILDFRKATIEKPERVSFHKTHLRPSWFVDVDAQEFDFSRVEWFGIPNTSAPTTYRKQLTLEKEIDALNNRPELEESEIEAASWWRQPEVASKPKVEGKPREDTREQSLDELARACRRLMNNAEKNRNYSTANEFNYWSMDAVRKRSWSSLRSWREHSGFITTVYWALSGYGVRAVRAFWALVIIWAVFATAYGLLDPPEFEDFEQGGHYVWQAAVYSLLALARLNPEPRPHEPGLFQFLVGFEGILGPLQIALLALAIRRKVMR